MPTICLEVLEKQSQHRTVGPRKRKIMCRESWDKLMISPQSWSLIVELAESFSCEHVHTELHLKVPMPKSERADRPHWDLLAGRMVVSVMFGGLAAAGWLEDRSWSDTMLENERHSFTIQRSSGVPKEKRGRWKVRCRLRQEDDQKLGVDQATE